MIARTGKKPTYLNTGLLSAQKILSIILYILQRPEVTPVKESNKGIDVHASWPKHTRLSSESSTHCPTAQPTAGQRESTAVHFELPWLLPSVGFRHLSFYYSADLQSKFLC